MAAKWGMSETPMFGNAGIDFSGLGQIGTNLGKGYNRMRNSPYNQASWARGTTVNPAGNDYGGMWNTISNPYMKPEPKPLPAGMSFLQGTPWGNFMQSPESFGGQFDNMQLLPWLMNQFSNRGRT